MRDARFASLEACFLCRIPATPFSPFFLIPVMPSSKKQSKRKRVNAEINYDAPGDVVELGIVESRGGTKITREAHVTRLNSPKRMKTTTAPALEPVLEDVPSPEPPVPQAKRKQVRFDKLCDRHCW